MSGAFSNPHVTQAHVDLKAHLHRRAVTVYRAVRKIERAVFYGDVYTGSGRTARLNGKPLGLETRAIFPKYRSRTARTDQSESSQCMTSQLGRTSPQKSFAYKPSGFPLQCIW